MMQGNIVQIMMKVKDIIEFFSWDRGTLILRSI